jgi:hypothetical protein
VTSDAPVAYWRLGEASGSTAADTTGTHAGTFNGNLTLGISGALLADPNTAIGTNGSTAYVGVPNAVDLNSTGDLTVEAWAKPNVIGGGAVVHKGGSTGYSVWQYRLAMTSTGRWRGTVFIGTSAYQVTDPGTPSTSGWTHLAMTRSGSTLTLYVNGVPVSTATAAGALNSSTGILAIGRTGAANQDYFNGSIDEVAVYGTSLSPARILAHYQAGIAVGP